LSTEIVTRKSIGDNILRLPIEYGNVPEKYEYLSDRV
jgi:hypothetical protein